MMKPKPKPKPAAADADGAIRPSSFSILSFKLCMVTSIYDCSFHILIICKRQFRS
jgi:hypothetical protein